MGDLKIHLPNGKTLVLDTESDSETFIGAFKEATKSTHPDDDKPDFTIASNSAPSVQDFELLKKALTKLLGASNDLSLSGRSKPEAVEEFFVAQVDAMYILKKIEEKS